MQFKLRSNGKIGWNDPCPCKSGLKYKYCHADVIKTAIVEDIARKAMARLIFDERVKRGIICKHGILKGKKCIDCSGPQELNIK